MPDLYNKLIVSM